MGSDWPAAVSLLVTTATIRLLVRDEVIVRVRWLRGGVIEHQSQPVQLRNEVPQSEGRVTLAAEAEELQTVLLGGEQKVCERLDVLSRGGAGQVDGQ